MSLYLLNRKFRKKSTFSNGKTFKKSHFLLIKYLDACGTETGDIVTNIYPSVPTMAENTFLSPSTIYECLADFKKEEILIAVGRTKYRTINYNMMLTRLDNILVPAKNISKLAHPSRNQRSIPPVSGPNTLCDSLVSSTKVIEKEKKDPTEELHLMSNKMADKEHIYNCVNKFGLSIEQIMVAISLCNTFNLDLDAYNKYFKVATCKIKEGESENRIKYVIQERINAIANKKPPRAQNHNELQRIEMSVADIVANGLNYNRNFNLSYVINAKYEYARTALIAAGVNFEIR